MGLVPSLGVVWPGLFSSLGVSAAVQPSFSVLTPLFTSFFLLGYLSEYAGRKITPARLKGLGRRATIQFVMFLVFGLLYFIAAELADRALALRIIAQYSQAVFLLVALPLAVSVSSLARAFILLGIRARLSGS